MNGTKYESCSRCAHYNEPPLGGEAAGGILMTFERNSRFPILNGVKWQRCGKYMGKKSVELIYTEGNFEQCISRFAVKQNVLILTIL